MTATEREHLRSAIDAEQRRRLIEDGDPIVPRPRAHNPKEATTVAKTETKKTTKTASTKRESARRRTTEADARRRAPKDAPAKPEPEPETVGEVEAQAETAAPAQPEAPAPDLVAALVEGVAAAVAGASRVNPPNAGHYFRIVADKKTLGYVDVLKRGSSLDLAVKFKITSEADVATAIRLLETVAQKDGATK